MPHKAVVWMVSISSFLVALTVAGTGAQVAPASDIATVDALEVQRRSGIDRGVAIVLGDDLELAVSLARGGKMLVHQLLWDVSRIPAARESIAESGMGGRVVVGPLSERLPHPDRFANLVVVDPTAEESNAHEISDRLAEELQRVLCDRGAALVRSESGWTMQRKNNSSPLDGWTHRWYDATGNCLSRDRVAGFPRAVQWQHGPAMEDGTADGKIPRIADGRWLIVDTDSGDLICRDAFNGTLLWRSPLALSAKEDLVVCDGRIYLYFDASASVEVRRAHNRSFGPLVEIDLATGKVLRTLDSSLRAGTASAIEFHQTDQDRLRRETPVPWFVVNENVIIQAYADQLVVIDRVSGQRRWTERLADAAGTSTGTSTGTWFSPIAIDGVVIVAEAEWPARRGRHDGSGHVRAVTAFSEADGKRLWRNDRVHPERSVEEKGRRYLSRAEFKPMSAADGLVLLHASSYQFRQGGSVAVLELATGRELWRHEFEAKSRYTQGSQRAVLRAGEVVLMDGLGALRFNARSGRPIGEPIDNKGGLRRQARANGACTASRATLDWLICNAYLYVGPDGDVQPQFATRGACGQGVIPAHGMIFVPPTPCDCGDYLRGHLALAPNMAGEPIADEVRVVKGPAYSWATRAVNDAVDSDSTGSGSTGSGSTGSGSTGSGSAARGSAARGSWPTFLGNSQRYSFQQSGLSAPAELKPTWRTDLVAPRRDDIDADRRFSEYHLGALSAPVGNESCVLVAAPEQHRVIAVDPKHGKQQWSFHAGGKVDSPPTIAGSLAVFGCADGCVYAVRLIDGELAWRFRAAPSTAVGMLHGHFASAFPLPGSVLVLGRNVIAVAGHHTDLGGLHCWVLDLATGQPRAERVIAADQPRVVTNGVAVADADGNGFWIGKQLHLSLALEDLAVDWYQGPSPPIAFDRNGTRMRFRTNEGRGGSTHGWKGAMSIPGRNRLLRGHRLVAAGETMFGLIDPGHRTQQSPIVWATKIADADSAVSWYQTSGGLGGHESYGALAATGEYVFIGGGNRDGSRGVVHVLNASTGQLVVSHDLPGRVAECGLAIADNRLFVSCENGTLASFSGNASR